MKNNIIKYAPIVVAAGWIACFILAFVRPEANYRVGYMVATGFLAIVFICMFIGGLHAGQTERTENEPRRDTEYNSNN